MADSVPCTISNPSVLPPSSENEKKLNDTLNEFYESSLEDLVNTLLKEDFQHRKIGQTENLLIIPKEKFFELFKHPYSISYGQPYKAYHVRLSDRHIYINDERRANFEQIPDFGDCILAGGALISLMRGQPVKDYDFFFVNKTIEEAKAIMFKFTKDYQIDAQEKDKKAMEKEEGEKNAKNDNKTSKSSSNYVLRTRMRNRSGLTYILRNYNSFTVTNIKTIFDHGIKQTKQNSNPAYQFILRNYQSIGQILHGFDLTASQIAYDGTNFYLTRSCLFNLKTNYIYFDFTVDSPSYMSRMAKYFNEKKFSYYLAGTGIEGKLKHKNIKYKVKGKYAELNFYEREPHNIIYVFDGEGFKKKFSEEVENKKEEKEKEKEKEEKEIKNFSPNEYSSEYSKFNSNKKARGLLRYKNLYQSPKNINNNIINKVLQFSQIIDVNVIPSENIFEPLQMHEINRFKQVIRMYLQGKRTHINLILLREILGLPLYSNFVMLVGNSSEKRVNNLITKFLEDHLQEIYDNVKKPLEENCLKLEFRGLMEGTHLKEV